MSSTQDIMRQKGQLMGRSDLGSLGSLQGTASLPVDKFQGLAAFPGVCGAVMDDYKRRSKHYVSDFVDGLHPKTLSSFLFMFFATFASTVALGVTVDDRSSGTNKCMGVTELVLSLALAGMVHSLVAGCPMAVLRPTGPITLFIVKLYGIGETLNVDFFEWLAWVGLWVGVYMIIIAAFDLCRHIRLCTRFLHDMFAFFVCTIYIHAGVTGVAGLWPDDSKQPGGVGNKLQWQDDNCESTACAYFSVILFCITLFGALALNAVTGTRFFNEAGRQLVKDYALTIAIFIAIGVGYLSPDAQDRGAAVGPAAAGNGSSWGTTAAFGELGAPQGHGSSNPFYVPHISLPKVFSPTFNGLAAHDHSSRPWFIGLSTGRSSLLGEYNTTTPSATQCGNVVGGPGCGFKVEAIFFAAVAAIPVTFWFYFDQLFSCLLHQIGMGPGGRNLEKGAYYHSSFLWMGIFNMVLPMFGLPFVTASLPHSPQFVRALQTKDAATNKVTSVVDNRVAPFLMYAFCGLALFLPTSGGGPKLLELVPKGVVYGILTFVGVAGILPETGNQLSKRLLLLASLPSEFPADELYTSVGWRTMHLFTFFQAGALAICWLINISSSFGKGQFWQYLGIFFPLWIVALIPLRKKLISKFIREEDLQQYLDAEDEQLAAENLPH